jgi:hypothetical protein
MLTKFLAVKAPAVKNRSGVAVRCCPSISPEALEPEVAWLCATKSFGSSLGQKKTIVPPFSISGVSPSDNALLYLKIIN